MDDFKSKAKNKKGMKISNIDQNSQKLKRSHENGYRVKVIHSSSNAKKKNF